MNVIRGFVTDPEILFLDEPTLGLDVNASRVIREYIVNWVGNGTDKTVLLTTHYMAEADQLCNRIAIINGGKILACDTPENLKKLVKMNKTFSLDVTLMNDKGALGSIKGVSNFTFSDLAETRPVGERNLQVRESRRRKGGQGRAGDHPRLHLRPSLR